MTSFKTFALRFTAIIVVLLSFSPLYGQKVDKLQQGGNGPLGSEENPMTWESGNVNHAKAHYAECMSIPYRLEVINLVPLTQYCVTIGWDTKKSGKHALDFLTSYDYEGSHGSFGHGALESIDLLLGTSLAGMSPPSQTVQIPEPDSVGAVMPGEPTNTFNALPVADRQFLILNGTINSIAYTNEDNLTVTDGSSMLQVCFQANAGQSSVILAWGGHIASKETWGDGNSASAITGSPYHMFLDACVDLAGCGNMEVQLAATAVNAPPECDISGPDPVCDSDQPTYTAVSGDGDEFLWEIINNNTGASIVGADNLQTVDIDPGTPGTFRLKVIVSKTLSGGVLMSMCDTLIT
ncbi:MAG: hypothetical protein OEM26_19530, partial [Saprospiraceae bacterium]|nr:hypothetical protein [Saprospiraceae bacterium]